MIHFEHVTKKYSVRRGGSIRTATAFRSVSAQEYTSIDNVSFKLDEGDSLAIIGANGAGKSTLLKLLTRVTRPTEGRIKVSGRISSLLEVGAGFHLDLSGRENIYLAGAILGMSALEVRKKIDEIVDFSGVADFISSAVGTYSSGMILRLAFSIGIHLNSDILVVDEALAVGDQKFQARCFDKISEFKRRGGSIVLVSHSIHQLRATCERGLLLDNGRLIYFGDTETAIEKYLQYECIER